MLDPQAGSDTNARAIADALEQIPIVANERLLLLGYSKGTVDILHFLANYPEPATRVSAVLSVAGAVNRSPLADQGATLSVSVILHCSEGRKERIISNSLRNHLSTSLRVQRSNLYFLTQNLFNTCLDTEEEKAMRTKLSRLNQTTGDWHSRRPALKHQTQARKGSHVPSEPGLPGFVW